MKFQEIMIFTFQSGTIQAYKSDSFDCLHGGTLHSNLVQFKRVKAMISIQDGIYFTFQSGTIQAKMRPLERAALTSLHSNLVQFKRMAICQAGRAAGIFTFQSGTIQAKKYQRVQ